MAVTDPLLPLRVLTQESVPFVVIGGHAVNFHGRIRATDDFDIVFFRSTDSELALGRALSSLHACWISDEIDPATGIERLHPVTPAYVRSTHLMMLWTDAGFLDIYDFIPGFPDEEPRQLLDSSQGADGIRYVGKAWLLKMKTAAGRPKDLEDVEFLRLLDTVEQGPASTG